MIIEAGYAEIEIEYDSHWEDESFDYEYHGVRGTHVVPPYPVVENIRQLDMLGICPVLAQDIDEDEIEWMIAEKIKSEDEIFGFNRY